jgi:dTDP-4-dehydrorhamnose reductase
MKILLTGANGQLGQELKWSCPREIHLLALARQDLDISDRDSVNKSVNVFKPDIIINAAAYTAVDAAEQYADLAHAINAQGAANLAQAALRQQCYLIHLSTDYIFDGRKSSPYLPEDKANPLSQYGLSKLRGEEKILEIFSENSLILRSSWIYSRFGKNFVKTMLNLMQQKEELRVVADQVGTPTSAKNLAQVIWHIIQNKQAKGIYHWTDEGVASWCDFAVAIQEIALENKILNKAIPIRAIRTQDYPTAARRPACSVLDKSKSYQDFGMMAQEWRIALREMVSSMTLHELAISR